MLDFHDGSQYRGRACMAWGEMQKPVSWFEDWRDMDAGYCLDAIDCSPAGGTEKLEPRDGAPFATPCLTWHRGII